MSKIAVIGAGIIGACAAESLERRGHSVTVFDAGQPATAICSFGNGVIIVPSHFLPLASPGTLKSGLKMMLDSGGPLGIRFSAGPDLWSWLFQFMKCATKAHVQRAAPLILDLNRRSKDLYGELAQRIGHPDDVNRTGMLMACETERTFEEEQEVAEMARKLGLDVETADRVRCQELMGGSADQLAGGLFYPGDASMEPSAFLPKLRTHLATRNVEIRYGSRVGSLDDLKAYDHVVLAGGVESRNLLAQSGLRLPLIGGQGQHVEGNAPGGTLHVPVILVDSRMAITPFADRIRFGGTMELGVSEPRINSKKLDRMIQSVQRFLPDLGPVAAQKHDVWAGLRPCLPDGLPAIGRLSSQPRVVLATGHAMMGWSLGPISGELVADSVEGKETDPLVSPARFGI